MHFQGFVGTRKQLIIVANERPLNIKRELHISKWLSRNERKQDKIGEIDYTHTTLSIKLLKNSIEKDNSEEFRRHLNALAVKRRILVRA